MWRCVRSEDHLILECHNIKHPLLSPAQSTRQYSESRVTVILTRIQCELVWCLLRQPASDGVMSQILMTSPDVICCHNVAIQSHSRVEHQHEHTSGESELNKQTEDCDDGTQLAFTHQSKTTTRCCKLWKFFWSKTSPGPTVSCAKSRNSSRTICRLQVRAESK